MNQTQVKQGSITIGTVLLVVSVLQGFWGMLPGSPAPTPGVQGAFPVSLSTWLFGGLGLLAMFWGTRPTSDAKTKLLEILKDGKIDPTEIIALLGQFLPKVPLSPVNPVSPTLDPASPEEPIRRLLQHIASMQSLPENLELNVGEFDVSIKIVKGQS